MTASPESATTLPSHFLRTIINDDLASGKHHQIHTRFPPEPNGYLHIGHAKSICINFGLANDYKGLTNLRFDDTNPSKEEQEYVDSIMADIRWLGFDWADRLYFASDYFQKLYDYALDLISAGKAFVCELDADQMREYRGTLTEPGTPSPFRDRPAAENLDLFTRMKNGEFKEGQYTLRAKIDMSSPNINMRDPVIYRIMHTEHHRTGNTWCIYPMYDYTHCISDALEGITHSICTLEFEDHRPLYDWYLDQLKVPCHPQQIEFARLNINYTVMSKRKLLELVTKGCVSGWDDPRMPTLSGLRRRGYTPEAIRNFAEMVGVAKRNSTVEFAMLEYCIREDLNKRAERRMAVLNPLKVVLTNYPEDQVEWLDAENNPENEAQGKRQIPFSREIYIERDDFMEVPPKKFHRLSPGKEVRIKHAYYITCNEVIKDATGEIVELRCTYDPESRGGWTNDGRVVKGTSHWVSVRHAKEVEIRLYDHLFTVPNPGEAHDYKEDLNPLSCVTVTGYVEPSLTECRPGDKFQFLRLGYFCADTKDSTPGKPVFNRIVGLKDAWAKLKPADTPA